MEELMRQDSYLGKVKTSNKRWMHGSAGLLPGLLLPAVKTSRYDCV